MRAPPAVAKHAARGICAHASMNNTTPAEQIPPPRSRSPLLHGVTRNVVMLGFVSLLTDVASEMLYPVIPLFVTGTLGASPTLLGLIDGIAEGGSSVLRWLAGAVSDRFHRRKPFIVAGYLVSAVSK